MNLKTTTGRDVERLVRWTKLDPYHLDHLDPDFWMTGAKNSLLCFCFCDTEGPVVYVRIDKEGNLCRLHTQFPPRDDVSKLRLVKAMLKCFLIVEHFCKQHGEGIIFSSESDLLISFMIKKFRFEAAGNNDYKLLFQEG
jgi:hypothetical protein